MKKGRNRIRPNFPAHTDKAVLMNDTLQAPPDKRQTRRSERWDARHVLWKMSRNARRRECGYKVRTSDGVTVRVTNNTEGRHAGYSGLSSCANVWACPVCSAKIANARQIEIKAALTEWTRRGGRVVLGTTTMRHYKRHQLGELWDGLTSARHAMLSGAGWQGEQRFYGTVMPRIIKRGKRAGEIVMETRVPVISVVEVTEGRNGWHVHLHMLLLVSGDVTSDRVETMGRALFGRWSAALVARGLPKPLYDVSGRGRDFALLHGDVTEALGEYFTKSVYGVEGSDLTSASMEVARGDMKDAHYGHRTPFGILRGMVQLVMTGDVGTRSLVDQDADEDLWHEWERVSAGRKQISWSVGLREWLAVLPVEEITDQEIVDVDAGGDEIHPVTALTWAAIRRGHAGARLLAAFEVSEDAGCLALARWEDAGFRWEAAHQPL
jgi:hypothetical protein